jgi:hypothetical protein
MNHKGLRPGEQMKPSLISEEAHARLNDSKDRRWQNKSNSRTTPTKMKGTEKMPGGVLLLSGRKTQHKKSNAGGKMN